MKLSEAIRRACKKYGYSEPGKCAPEDYEKRCEIARRIWETRRSRQAV